MLRKGLNFAVEDCFAFYWGLRVTLCYSTITVLSFSKALIEKWIKQDKESGVFHSWRILTLDIKQLITTLIPD